MGKVIESEECVLQITKAQFVDGMLSSVQPSVAASDIFAIGNAADSSFIEVAINPVAVSGKTTTKYYGLNTNDLAALLSSLTGGVVNYAELDRIEIDSVDTTKINVYLKRKQTAVYQG